MWILPHWSYLFMWRVQMCDGGYVDIFIFWKNCIHENSIVVCWPHGILWLLLHKYLLCMGNICSCPSFRILGEEKNKLNQKNKINCMNPLNWYSLYPFCWIIENVTLSSELHEKLKKTHLFSVCNISFMSQKRWRCCDGIYWFWSLSESRPIIISVKWSNKASPSYLYFIS